MDGLAAMVQQVLQTDPFQGDVFIFHPKRADRVKILAWDDSGLALIWKQLEANTFRWPPVADGVMRLSAVEFAALFSGVDWRRVQATREIPKPSAAA